MVKYDWLHRYQAGLPCIILPTMVATTQSRTDKMKTRPTMKLKISRLLMEFLESEKTGGLILFFCTISSLLFSNSRLGHEYVLFWHRYLDLSFLGMDLKHTLVDWINDGLMTFFFLLVGLEIEREFYKGELSGIKNALLPIVAALGGMVFPAAIHFFFNVGTDTQSGFGIPIATDIAFALAVAALLGERAPLSLKILLTALAIIDDLGAILVIAIFYAHDFSVFHFTVAVLIFVGLVFLNRLKVNALFCYLLPGVAMWSFMLKSGIHPTITGVLLAFCIPFRQGDQASPSWRIQHYLDKPVPFVILPLFALSNTALVFEPGWYSNLIGNNAIGIIVGLVVGKPIGIFLFSLIAVKIGLSQLPNGIKWRHIIGMGALAGIGFTMSIFIANLAFSDKGLIQNSKIDILCASAIAGLLGFLLLSITGNRSRGSER